MTRYLQVFTSKRMLIVLLLGFSSGLPLALVGATLQAWLTTAKVDIISVGEFALIGLPYTMKFLWAPFLDSRPLPFLGLRRGWMALTQVGLFITTIILGMMDPTSNMAVFSLVAMVVAIFSASQDIVIDAYRTEIVNDQAEYGATAGTFITGYRIAMFVSGGFALGLADHMPWSTVYLIMACVNLVGLATVFFAPEPTVTRAPKKLKIREAVISPFMEFFQREGAMEILIFIMIYKISTLMATALTTRFLQELHYSLTVIGGVNKGAGLIATVLGTLAGGSLMIKFGLKRSLWVFGIAQGLVGLTFCVLAQVAGQGDSLDKLWLVTIVSLDNFMMGMGTAALAGFMMNFCSTQYTATQFALLTSVMAVSRVILTAHAGSLVAWLGWNTFFILTVPLAIPGLLLLHRFDHWESNTTKPKVYKKIPAVDLGIIAVFVISLIALSSDPVWQFLGLKPVGDVSKLVGAFGVVAVVIFNLIRPYLIPAPKPVSNGI